MVRVAVGTQDPLRSSQAMARIHHRDLHFEADAARPSKLRRVDCRYFQRCHEYLQSLDLLPDDFDCAHDRCYCQACTVTFALPETMDVAGMPYELPLGFAGFGIKVPARASGLRIFADWHVSYHGLSALALASVLREGSLLLPGDVLLDGSTVEAVHTIGGAESVQLYTSPSPRCAEMDIYTSPAVFKNELAKVVLQCRQKPGYGVNRETVGLTWQVSKHFGNSVIERYTRARASIIPYRVLVKLEPPTFQVNWSGRTLGATTVTLKQVQKCHDEEYLVDGDVVTAAYDLDSGTVGHAPDSEGAVVKAGSTGILRRPSDSGFLRCLEWPEPGADGSVERSDSEMRG